LPKPRVFAFFAGLSGLGDLQSPARFGDLLLSFSAKFSAKPETT
jgi:hypothetical protein